MAKKVKLCFVRKDDFLDTHVIAVIPPEAQCYYPNPVQSIIND